MCIDDSSKLYVKLSIELKGSTVVSMKQSLSGFNSTNEHKFMLNGDSLENIKIKIQVKKSTYKWIKSELSLFVRLEIFENIIICVWLKTATFLDPDLCQLSLWSTECERAGDHWKKMLENPEEKISLWHEAHPVIWDEQI